MRNVGKIIIQAKLPDYCRTTKYPKYCVLQVKTPEKWLPTYQEIAELLKSLDEVEKYNRSKGAKYHLIQDMKQEVKQE